MIDSKEGKSKGMKGETRQMFCAFASFYRTIVDPMVQWSFEHARSLLKLDNINNPVQIDPNIVLARIVVSDFELDYSFIDFDQI
jgi:hypothetical protein